MNFSPRKIDGKLIIGYWRPVLGWLPVLKMSKIELYHLIYPQKSAPDQEFLALENYRVCFIVQARNLRLILGTSLVFTSRIYTDSENSGSVVYLYSLRFHLSCSSWVPAIISDLGFCSYYTLPTSPHLVSFSSSQSISHTAARGTLSESTCVPATLLLTILHWLPLALGKDFPYGLLCWNRVSTEWVIPFLYPWCLYGTFTLVVYEPSQLPSIP